MRRVLILGFALALSACAEMPSTRSTADPAKVQDIHACAIGYDLARAVSRKINVRGTVLEVPTRQSACEVQMIHYLRLAGYAIEEVSGGRGFDVSLNQDESGAVQAVGKIGDTLTVSRQYRLAPTGVYALSDISIFEMDWSVK
jgi:hypothetical protein